MSKAPRIVLIDIETSPILGYTWGVYDQNVLKVLAPSKIISVAWKWLDDKSTTVKALPDFQGYKADELDDEKLVKMTWQVLDEADVVIAHNGDSFDIKKLNARFVHYGLNAPSGYQTIDTKKVAKKYFRFDNNSLKQLGLYLDEGTKLETGGFDLWERCIAGEGAAWNKMKRYNARDVELLERVYLRLRPFMNNHPNLKVIVNPTLKKGQEPGQECPVCLSLNTQRRGFAVTRTGRYQRFQCGDCGSWSKGPHEKAKGVALR